jgi:hypothetical protein
LFAAAAAGALAGTLASGKPNSQPQYRMRVQLQDKPNHTIGTHLESDKPITVEQVWMLLDQLYAEVKAGGAKKWYPKKAGLPQLAAEIGVVKTRLLRYPPLGISGEQLYFEQRRWTIRGYPEFRLDVDNLSGWNLRS